MHRYHRIVWNEGLFLTPHHFQQSDLYHEAQLIERLSLLGPWWWGVHSMEVDQENLARGVFRLLSFKGLFPNGVLVSVPEMDQPPPSIPFKDIFDVRSETLDVYLGVPARRSGWANTLLPGQSTEAAGDIRYTAQAVPVEDENTGKNERTVHHAAQNLKLLPATENRDSYDCIPLARVARSSSGGYALVEDFVPPALSMQASPYMQRLVRSLLERLVARSSELAGRFTEAGSDARDITPANLRAFLQFSVVNGVIPMLAHARNSGTAHPEDIYRMLAGLAGGLSTFNSRKLHPRDVPPYDHQNLGPVFGALDRIIVDLLELQVSQGYIVIPLTPLGEGRFQGTIDKDSLLEPSAAIFLAVSGENQDERFLMSASSRVIIASLDRIQQKINMRLPGLPLHHMAVPPPAIPRRRGTVYFELDKRSPDWEAIKMARNLAVDLPPDFRGVQIELLALEGAR